MDHICFFRKDALNDCNMTYLAHHVTSCDLDLRSDFDIDLFRSTCTYFDAFRREEHDAAKIMSLALLVQKVFAKTSLKKRYFDLS